MKLRVLMSQWKTNVLSLITNRKNLGSYPNIGKENKKESREGKEKGEEGWKECIVHIWKRPTVHPHFCVALPGRAHHREEVKNPDERIRYAYRITGSSPFRRNRHLMLVHSLWMNVELYIEISGKSTYQPIKHDQIKTGTGGAQHPEVRDRYNDPYCCRFSTIMSFKRRRSSRRDSSPEYL